MKISIIVVAILTILSEGVQIKSNKGYYINNNPVVINYDISNDFSKLSDQEKHYAYFMSKASWAGAKMVFHQISYEAPALFLVL
jgi:dipeptidyl-peptidase-3